MRDSPGQRPEPADHECAPGPPRVLLEALAFGAVAGAVVAVGDVHRHVAGALGADFLWALFVGGAPGALAGLLLGGLLLAALRLAGRTSAAGASTGALAGLAVGGGAAAAVLLTTRDPAGWRGMALLLAGLALGCATLAAFLRFPRLARPGRSAALALGVLLAALVLAGTPGLLRGLGAGGWVPWAPRVAALALLAAALLAFPARPAVVAGALGGALCLLVLGLAWGGPGPAEPPPPRTPASPNVMLVVLDTTRRDHLGCYGSQGGLTPALDRLAAEGVVYEDAFAPSHWTAPSHASLFTGLPPISHGCSREFRLWLAEESETLAERLKERGYDTLAMFSNPWLHQANMLQGFDAHVNLLGRYTGLAAAEVCTRVGVPERWIDKGAAVAERSLESWFEARRGSPRPFFLFVNLLEAHGKYLPPRDERAAYLPDGVGFDEATRFADTFLSRNYHMERNRDPYAERVVRGLYAGGIRYQDRRLGELVDLVDLWADLDNTLLVVTADHGENLNDDGRWDHEFAVNDTLIHVPLVIRYPRLFTPGLRLSGLCSLIDVLPTTLAVVDPEATHDLPGADLAPAAFQGQREVFCQMFPHYPDFTGTMRARGALDLFSTHWRVVRTAEWKFVWSADGRHRLYDLREDPGETRNVLTEHPNVAAELERRLATWLDAQPRFELRELALPMGDAKQVEDLRSLGYGG